MCSSRTQKAKYPSSQARGMCRLFKIHANEVCCSSTPKDPELLTVVKKMSLKIIMIILRIFKKAQKTRSIDQ